MPPSTIPSTSSATSSPGRRFGSSDQRRWRNGAAQPTRHDDSPRSCISARTLNLTVPVGHIPVGVDVINPVRRLLKPKSLTIVGSQSPEHNWKRQLEIGFGDFEHPAAFLFAFSATFEIYRGLSDLSAPNSARGSGQLDRHNGRRAHLRSPRRKNGPNRTEKQGEIWAVTFGTNW